MGADQDSVSGAGASSLSGANATAAGPRTGSLRVVAFMAVFNEADILEPVLEHLVSNDIEVYLLDHHSTDATVQVARRFLGDGLIGIETFPAAAADCRFSLVRILRRVEDLTHEIQADWFMHHDADEIRESPFPGQNLNQAIGFADSQGYNSIGFRIINFPPVDNSFREGSDPREHFRYWEEASIHDQVQVKCWKAGSLPVNLAESGGHNVRFNGCKRFPIDFILRHYPIRSQRHGEQKIFVERRPRYAPDEVDKGWHCHYADVDSTDHCFLADPKRLELFDLDEFRLRLLTENQRIDELGSSSPVPHIQDQSSINNTGVPLRTRLRLLLRGGRSPRVGWCSCDDITTTLKTWSVEVEDLEIDVEAFERFVEDGAYRNRSFVRGGDQPTAMEKYLEHFVSMVLLEPRENHVLIDIGAGDSPFATIMKERFLLKGYRQDVAYPTGFLSDTIGCEVDSIPVGTGFADLMSLHCVFEHFEGDKDISFLKEAQRVLKPGGRLCIVPMYTSLQYSIQTDPSAWSVSPPSFDRDASICLAPGWGQAHGRFYDPAHFKERIVDSASSMTTRFFRINNGHTIDRGCYLRHALLLTKESSDDAPNVRGSGAQAP